MGIISYIKLAGVVVVFAVLGYFYWSYNHMQKVIEAQHMEIENLKLGQQVLDAKQQKFDEFMAKKTTTTRRVQREQTDITKDINTVDNAGIDKLYDNYRVRPKSQTVPPAPWRKGGPKNPSPGSP